MPHLRTRYLESILKRYLTVSPIVGVLGHRQVGKTTLLEKVCDRYLTFDSLSELDAATNDPEEYIRSRESKGVLGIDECQLVPGLFPTLKDRVRLKKRPGQYLLSGSVRFTSLEQIKESLTGRIMNLELLPFSLSELEARPLPTRLTKAIASQSFESLAQEHRLTRRQLDSRRKLMRTYFQSGGLPGIAFLRNEKLRHKKIDQQLRTLLDRDLRLVTKTKLSLSTLRQLASQLANIQGIPVEWRSLSKKTGISIPTLKKLVFGFEAIFMVRTLLIEGGMSGFVLFFEDMAEAEHLREIPSTDAQRLMHFLYANIRVQFEYDFKNTVKVFQYRTRGGAFVPLVFQNQKGEALGVILMADPSDLTRYMGSANSFLKSYGSSKILLLHSGEDWNLVQPRVLVAPILEMV